MIKRRGFVEHRTTPQGWGRAAHRNRAFGRDRTPAEVRHARQQAADRNARRNPPRSARYE